MTIYRRALVRSTLVALTAAILAFFAPARAFAAWGAVGNTSIQSSKTAGTTLSWDLPSSTIVGNYVILVISFDNTSTTDGETSEVSSVIDGTATNTYTKLKEFVNGQGAAGAGQGVSVWIGKQNESFGGTGTITFANSITAKAVWKREFSVGAGNVVTIESYATNATDGANFPSMNLSPTSGEYLWLRAIGWEEAGDAPGVVSVTSNFTEAGPNGTSGGAADSNSSVYAEYRIFTGSSNASAPSWSGTQQDNANIYLALKEAAPGGGGSAAVPVFMHHYNQMRN